MNKLSASAGKAVADIRDGATLMMGGFGLCGIPENLIKALAQQGSKGLTVISNNVGTDKYGIGLLINNGQIKKMIMSYGGENNRCTELLLNGGIEVEWTPQGTLAERIRAGGAGIGGFFTPTGFATLVAEGKETRQIDGRWHVLEKPLRADFAFIKAYKGDTQGNLVYRKTARNFNPMMATAADTVIAEVEHLVDAGSIDPDTVHTPGIYIHRIIKGKLYEKTIERLTVRKAETSKN